MARLPYTQQKVSILGLDSEEYSKDIAALRDIFDVMSREVPLPVERTLNSVTAHGISFTNRFFTRRTSVTTQIIVPITQTMDPTQELRRNADSADLVHTDDNHVEFLRLAANQ